jgi:hypothetical protein
MMVTATRPVFMRPGFVVGFLIAVTVLIHLPTLASPLVEVHAFRQTQTAYTALIYHRQGIDLLHTPLPILGPPWELPFEFPLFQGIAAVAMNAGVGVEAALRGTDLAFFLVTGVLLWAMLRRSWSASVATAALVAFCFSPFGLEWSRTSMIEYLATAGAVGAAASALRWNDTGRRRWLALAVVLGIVGALVKLATAAVWLVPMAFVLRRRPASAVVLLAVPIAFGIAWTRYADSIKATGVLSGIFTSNRLIEWTFGTVDERLNPETWGAIIWNLVPLGLAGLVWVVFLRHDRAHRRLWGYFLAVVALAIVTFPTLYARHSYYAAAITPAVAALLGAGFVAALQVRPRPYVFAVSAFLVAFTFAIRVDAWRVAFWPGDPDSELVSAAQIRSETQPGDLILIVGRDYSPAIFFYADRHGIMMPTFADRVTVPPSLTAGYRIFDCPSNAGGACIER